jgi:DNA polymerase I
VIKDYGLVESVEELKFLMDKFLEEGTPVGLDIETGYDGPDKKKASVHPEEAYIVGISFTNSLDWARYVPLRHDFEDNFDNRVVAELLWPVLKSGLVVAHNAKFELSFLIPWLLEYLGPEIVGDGKFKVLSDTMIEAAMTSAYRSNGLKDLVEIIFGHTMKHFVELFEGAGESRNQFLRFNVLPLSRVNVDYACEDALWALALHQLHYPMVKDSFIYKLEMEVLYVILDMQTFGVCFDWELMRKYSEQCKEFQEIQYAAIQDKFSEMLGEPVSINLGSPKQVQELLYDKLGFSTTRYTKSTKDSDNPKMSTDTIALEALAKKHPVVRMLVEYREVKKLIGSYLDKYERDYGYDLLREGVVHPGLNQVFVISGRFSASDPNYQQLPGGNKEYQAPDPRAGKKMTRYEVGEYELELCFRDVVVTPEGYYAVGFDYGQAELRAIAGEAQEPYLLKAFADGADIHTRIASLMFGVPEDQVDSPMRKKGKTLNFALAFQLGVDSLADRLGISVDEAQELYDRYFEVLPNVKKLIQDKMDLGRKLGYSVTKFGRKMTIWEYQDKRKYMQSKAGRMAFNTVIQGSATGDVPKIAMVRAVRALEAAGLSDRVHLVMNIHDALEFYVRNDVDYQTVIDILEPAVVFPIPGWPAMVADWHTWTRYGSCVELKRDETGRMVEKH